MKETIALVMYANPDYYPPVYSMIKLLVPHYRVLLVCRGNDSPMMEYGDGVDVLRLGRQQPREEKFRRSMMAKFTEFLVFMVRFASLVRRNRCKMVYAFDAHGFCAGFLASRMGKRLPLVYHNFDLGAWDEYKGPTRLIKRFEVKNARRADLVVFSSRRRAEIFMAEAKLPRMPEVVLNAPLSVQGMPEPLLRREMARRGIPESAAIILYAGVIDDVHCAGELIRSIPLWPRHAVLCLVGTLHFSFQDTLKRLQQEHDLRGRVVVLPFIPYNVFFPGMISGAALGMALFKPINDNFATMAGASCKILQYFSLGVPCVVNNDPVFKEVFGEELVYWADHTSAEDIARAVNRALSDPGEYGNKSAACRRAHSGQFNFERQFAPVAGFIAGRMAGK